VIEIVSKEKIAFSLCGTAKRQGCRFRMKTRFVKKRKTMMQLMTRILLLVICTLPVTGLSYAAELSGTAADFTLKSNGSGNLRLKEHLGQVVLLNFWASWCGPCRQEMPLLEEIYQKYRKFGFIILAISVDEEPREADEFMSEVKVTFPYLYDTSNKVSELYAVEAMPTTILIDRNGQRRFLHKGYQPGFEQKYLHEVKLLIRE
jgi:thiol-disulfide isomerase/thioredoxin